MRLEPTVLEKLEGLEDVARIHDALAQLDVRCYDLLHALFLEDPAPGYAEVSRRSGIPKGSIGPTRARCLKKMQNMLAELSNDGPSASTDREASVD